MMTAINKKTIIDKKEIDNNTGSSTKQKFNDFFYSIREGLV